MDVQVTADLLRGMLNPFLFLAVGFFWMMLCPRLPGSWALLAGGCLLFLTEALAYYEATHPTNAAWVSTGPYAATTAIAPLLLALGVLLVVRAELAS